MAKQRKGAIIKEPVTIRQKLLFKGTAAKTKEEKAAITIEASQHPQKFYWSLYLDIYKDGIRKYKFLGLQLIPELEGDQFAKVKNKNTMTEATQIKAQEIILLENEPANKKEMEQSEKGKMLFVDLLEMFREKRATNGKKSRATIFASVKGIAQQYSPATTLNEIDKAFCLGFVDFMKNDYRTKGQNGGKLKDGKKLAASTIKTYFDAVNTALKFAEQQKIIEKNPIVDFEQEEKVKKVESKRDFLTIEEIGLLMKQPCKYDILKRAYLFSCFCGLRISDIRQLKWENLYNDGNSWKASIIIQKTKKQEEIYLSETAMSFLPKRGKATSDQPIFVLPCPCQVEKYLRLWAKEAGIKKNITYHTSRHTFATMMLTLGADLYTTSKLLGHSGINTTQIYAKIVDEKKKEAVNLTNGLFPTMQNK